MQVTFKGLGKFIFTVAVCSILALLSAHNTSASTQTVGGVFTVNSAADTNAPDSVLTMREALLLAKGRTGALGHGLTNAEKAQLNGCSYFQLPDGTWNMYDGCGDGFYDTIHFNIPNCPCTISLGSMLPIMTDANAIDGYSQPGSKPNSSSKASNAIWMVTLNGGSAVTQAFDLTGGGTTVKGFNIGSFTQCAIELASSSNTITGNFIHNSQYGICVDGVNNVIGDGTPAGRNLINSNTYMGIYVSFNRSASVQNNLIGVGADGKQHAGNGWDGIASHGTSVLISHNQIANNGKNGVRFFSDAKFNRVTHNAVYANSMLGIGLDAGANDSQTFPTISSANSATKLIKGNLTGAPNTTYSLEFFSNRTCDASNYGEGKTFLGSVNVKTDPGGSAKFAINVSRKFSAGSAVAATATAPNGDSSGFSKCKSAK